VWGVGVGRGWNDEMTLVADRFIRFDDGTVRDLATGERVTLIELTLTSAADQVARRDYCLARLDAEARGLAASCEESSAAAGDVHAPSRDGFALVDFTLVGESCWIEAYRTTTDSATSQEWDMWRGSGIDGRGGSGGSRGSGGRGGSGGNGGSGYNGCSEDDAIAGPVVDAIAETLDCIGSRDVRRLYVKASDSARLDNFQTIVAREVRARGFIPLSASVVSSWPTLAPLLASRSIVLFGDARCVFSNFGKFGSFTSVSRSSVSGSLSSAGGSIARAVALLHRTACLIAAVVGRVCDHVNVAAFRFMSPATIPRAAFASRPASVLRIVSTSSSESHSPQDASSSTSWLPQSVVQPAVAVSYDDPNLPSLFPRTDQIAHVAETGTLAPFASDSAGAWDSESASESDTASIIESTSELAATSEVEAASEFEAVVSRYPPLRLVERRSRSEPVARAPVEIPVVTTMVSGYGAAVDVLVGRGRWAPALRALRAEVAAHERRKHRYDAARTSIALGRLHLAIGEVGPATRCFNRAAELASAYGAARDADLGPGLGPGPSPGSGGAGEVAPGAIGYGGSGYSEFDNGGSDYGSARLIGEALRWSGIAALDDGDLERSERLLRTALVAIGPEADPHQVFAIELALARCLFWQGRGREVVLPSLDASSTDRDTLATVILRVERWRRAARIALADGDLSSAGDAIARACRIACGDAEDDVRSLACRIAPARKQRPTASTSTSTSASISTTAEAANEVRIREALRAACHLDAARLQFAIGDTGSGDAHLRESLALSRAPARTARVQVLQLARFRSYRTSEGRRRFERLSSALRQPRTPRLVRIQARYLIDPRSRRALELVTFLDRHGDTALAGYGHTDRRGGSPMLEAFQDVLRICHETPDDLTALAQVSAYLRDQLRALSVAIYGAPPGQVTRRTIEAHQNDELADERSGEQRFDERDRSANSSVVVRYAVAGSTRVLSPELAMRAIDSGLLVPPTYRPDALDAAAPVRYGGAPIGAIVVRWSIDAAIDHTTASALISAAAAAVSPHLRAALDREQPDAGLAFNNSRASSSARTLGLLGISSTMDTLRRTITRVAAAPFHVLIEGESGSGKELVARALHQHGPRRHRRFCAVNCAAFTDELLEAELFGHTRGAFTGALTERAGLFEEADGGTLFLDEIGELSPRGQAKLLRVIQDGETRRIGENLPRRVDTRIVAATNRSLRHEADAGQFRADLLYRLDVIRIDVPPLRVRPEDVPVLARAFWDEAIARLGSRATLDPATLTALARYHWPGNVRELHNAIMALAVHAPPRGRVTPSMLPASIRAPAPSAAANDDAAGRANGDAYDVADESDVATSDDAIAVPTDGASDATTDVTTDVPGNTTARSTRGARAAPPGSHGGGELPPFEGRLEDARRAFESRYIRAALARAGAPPAPPARSA
jgi:transcriptional regulator with GAF, ATPase, and Fis domain